MSRLTLILAFLKMFSTETPSNCICSKSCRWNETSIQFKLETAFHFTGERIYLNVELHFLDGDAHEFGGNVEDARFKGRGDVKERRFEVRLRQSLDIHQNSYHRQIHSASWAIKDFLLELASVNHFRVGSLASVASGMNSPSFRFSPSAFETHRRRTFPGALTFGPVTDRWLPVALNLQSIHRIEHRSQKLKLLVRATQPTCNRWIWLDFYLCSVHLLELDLELQ